MELTKTDVGDSQDGHVFLKGQHSSGSRNPLDISPLKKSFEGKDDLSYANILRSRNKFMDAFAVYESVLEKDGENVEAHIGKGICLQMQNLERLAYESFAEAVRLDPQNACALTHCGNLYKDEGRLVEAAENRLLDVNYINEGTDDKLYEAHRDWGRRFMRSFLQYTFWYNIKDPERLLVIGYVSPDYFTHSVSYFIDVPRIYHDYGNYKVVVYSAVAKMQKQTDLEIESSSMAEYGGIFMGLMSKKVANMVREDEVDILVELTGHTANNKLGMMACRLGMMACRPAPVQVTWIGYPNTTGLPTIDYRITDALADPPDTKQKHVEELVRFPDSFLCYTPSPEVGPVSPTPALSNGFITFGSFNNLAKCETAIFFNTGEVGMESLCVDLLPLILLNHDHLQAYDLMDIRLTGSSFYITLDTFPYAGTTTTCESLYMGVPCVTMGGLVHAHNVGVSLLKTVELSNLVANNEDEYVELALQLASDITALSNLRMRLRHLILKSPLCDGSKFTQGLESAYRNMWQRYCKGDVPSLRHMEMAQLQQQLHSQQVVPEEQTIRFAESSKENIISRYSLVTPIKANGFKLEQCSSLNASSHGEGNESLVNKE